MFYCIQHTPTLHHLHPLLLPIQGRRGDAVCRLFAILDRCSFRKLELDEVQRHHLVSCLHQVWFGLLPLGERGVLYSEDRASG